MEQSPAIVHGEGSSDNAVKEIKYVTIVLTVLTLIELALGYWMIGMADGLGKHFVKGVILILMLAKAFYIVGYFMHLKHEVRNLIMTIVIPAMLFIWFILAFLMDGNSYNNLRNEFNPYYKERGHTKVAPKPETEEGHKKEIE